MKEFTPTVIARAVSMFNALHNLSITPQHATSLLELINIAHAAELPPMLPQVIAAEGEDLLDAVVRAYSLRTACELLFGDHVIHLDPGMTLTDAVAHAKYVIDLDMVDRDGDKSHELTPVATSPFIQTLGRGLRPKDPKPAMIDLDHADVHANPVEQKSVTAPVEAAAPAPATRKDDDLPPPYIPLETGKIHYPANSESVEDFIRRMMPVAPCRVRIGGVVMTVREDLTVPEMIREANRRISNRISDAEGGREKVLPADEEVLPDGTLRTAFRCWRRGYRFRLDVLPYDRTEIAEYHIHLKERPTQAWMEPHLQLMYDRRAKVFLNITNGRDRFENILHFFCTSEGRQATAELERLDREYLDDYEDGTRTGFSWDSFRKSEAPKATVVDDAEPVMYRSEAKWEKQGHPYRVRYWNTKENCWLYSYFAARPGALATKVRDVAGKPATVEEYADFLKAESLNADKRQEPSREWNASTGGAGHASTDNGLNPVYSK